MKRVKPESGPKLRPWQEWAVYGVMAGMAATGFAWLVLHQFVTVEGAFGPSRHPAEHLLLVIHGVLGFPFLVLVGMILERHVPAAWGQRRNLYTGIGLLTALGSAALTALGLYYLADERLRAWASVMHWSAGAAALVVLIPHAVRRGSSRRASAGSVRPGRAGPKGPMERPRVKDRTRP